MAAASGATRLAPGWRTRLAPPLIASYVTSGARMALRALRGHHRHAGDAAAICRAVIRDCWTGDYLAASGGHFRQFWTRDLAYSAAPLVRLGEAERVRASLAWALRAWSRRGEVTTTIFPGRRPLDVYTFGADALPLLLHALRVAGAEDLVARHRWLGGEVERYARIVVDRRTGLASDDRAFSTHRDVVITRSNAQANAMVVLLSQTLRATGWFRDPVPDGITDRFVDAFWAGDRFRETPGGERLTGDATVLPFWLGIVPDSLGLAAALRALDAGGLTDPLPLRYSPVPEPGIEDPVARGFAPDYQGSAVWTSLGGMFLALLRRVDPVDAEARLARYAAFIEREGTVWEVLDGRAPPGILRPYVGRFGLFRSDEAMLWAALFLDLLVDDGTPGSTAGPAPARRSEPTA